MYKYLFYLQREPILPNHFQMIRGLKQQLDNSNKFESVRRRLDLLDNIEPNKKNIVSEWCRKNKVRLELLICIQGNNFTNKVDFVLGYSLGKYLINYINKLDIPYLDLSKPDMKEHWVEMVKSNTALPYIEEWYKSQTKKNNYLIPEFISNNQFDYVEKQYA